MNQDPWKGLTAFHAWRWALMDLLPSKHENLLQSAIQVVALKRFFVYNNLLPFAGEGAVPYRSLLA